METGDWRPLKSRQQSLISSLQSLSLYLILGIATFLRFHRLDGSSLWSDEGNTWALLSRSFGQIARDAAADIHPPGYYWLLKLWTAVAGRDAWGMRSFSALAGVLLIWVVYRIVLALYEKAPPRVVLPAVQNHKSVALLAALLAALNPFLVYYSQEARMYMLLALAGAGLVWASLALLNRLDASTAGVHPPLPATAYLLAAVPRALPLTPAIVYFLAAVIGLWTHYSFPVLLAAVVLAYGFAATRRSQFTIHNSQFTIRFLLLNLLALLLFLPWLPTAIDRILAWPKGGVEIGWAEASRLTLQTLLFGPIRNLPSPLWPWLLSGALLPLIGLWAVRRQRGSLLLALWFLAPIGLMLGLGLYSDAFLKFLLVAAPAWSIAAAAATAWPPLTRLGSVASRLSVVTLTVIAVALAVVSLPGYYADPAARDNYAGVARFIATLGDPTDLVILNAPGQREVWGYYDPGLPVLALPQERPPDPVQTVETLAQMVEGRRHVYALFWATDEADPNGLVEGWLNQHLFKGLESWQGNLRFVMYTTPTALTWRPLSPPIPFGETIVLLGSDQAPSQQVAPGEVAPLTLHWAATQPLSTRYKVTVQLLDERNQVTAQHDSEPAGGVAPTDSWQPGKQYVDRHGIFISPGAPPGSYRLLIALYDPATGERLPTPEGDALIIGEIDVAPRLQPVPLDIVPIQQRLGRRLGPVTLAGYDLYRKGFAHAPATPLAAGDLVHVTLYWQAPDPLPPDWPDDLAFQLQLGQETITAPLAGGRYPTGEWRAGELVRGEFDLRFDGASRRPLLQVGAEQIHLAPVPR